MKVQIEVDGKTEEVDISFDTLTLRESADVQRQVGTEVWDDFVENEYARPVVIEAILLAKLRRLFPTLDLDTVDVDWGDISTVEADPTKTG